MKPLCLALIALAALLPSSIHAKGPVVVRITIQGDGLQAPVEIRGARRLDMNISSGRGIKDGGMATPPSAGARQFRVSFFVKDFNPDDPENARGPERLSDVVGYAYDPVTTKGYFYFPGTNDGWPEIKGQQLLRYGSGAWVSAPAWWNELFRPLLKADP